MGDSRNLHLLPYALLTCMRVRHAIHAYNLVTMRGFVVIPRYFISKQCALHKLQPSTKTDLFLRLSLSLQEQVRTVNCKLAEMTTFIIKMHNI